MDGRREENRRRPGQASAERRRTVLVVDDDTSIGDLLRIVLERSGYEVLYAEHGRQALAIFCSHPEIELVILDLSLPEIDGAEVLARMLAERSEARVVVSSGYISEEEEERLCRLGAQACLHKPYRPRELRELVARLLSGEARAA